MGHATMSTEPENDRPVTVHAPFLAKCNFSSSSERSVHNVRTIVVEIVGFVCFGEEKETK